ncbi:MAG: GNAT family protein [bacterium]|nr:GNAT family protein [bacterium]
MSRRSGTVNIESERLLLRPAVPDDAKDIVNAIHASDLQNFSFFRKSLTLKRERKYLEKIMESPSDLLYIIFRKEDERLIGSIGMHDMDMVNRNARLGISLFSKENWGNGYASEALRSFVRFVFNVSLNYSGDTRFRKLHLNVFVENKRAQKRYTALGFRKDGVLRSHYLLTDKNGNEEWHDMVHMSLLRSEWELAQQKGAA